jgi:hypothetical protein
MKSLICEMTFESSLPNRGAQAKQHSKWLNTSPEAEGFAPGPFVTTYFVTTN